MALSSKIGIDSLDLKDKRVLMRVDFNVPHEGGKDYQHPAHRPPPSTAFRLALEKGAALRGPHEPSRKTRRTAHRQVQPQARRRGVCRSSWARRSCFLSDCVGAEVEAACLSPAVGSVILLENLRFHVEEEGKGVGADGGKVKAEAGRSGGVPSVADEAGGRVRETTHSGRRIGRTVSMVGVELEQRAAGLLLKKELSVLRAGAGESGEALPGDPGRREGGGQDPAD